VSAVPFGRAARREDLKLASGFSFRSDFLAEFAARVGLAIESLRDGCGAAHVAKSQDFDVKIPAVVGYV
jgi:hypothetical protein